MARETQFAVSVFAKITIFCGFWWIDLPLRRGYYIHLTMQALDLFIIARFGGKCNSSGKTLQILSPNL